MVDDDQIKALVSPFAVKKDEIKKFDGKDGYVSMNQIVRKIDMGQITDIHFAILEFINEFEFMTSRQIYQLLEWKGINPKSQDKLSNKLEQLVKSKILTRYYFISENGQGTFRTFCMDKMGKYLLMSKDIECRWQPSDNTKTVPMIKKRLAGNQVIIAYLRKVKAFDRYIAKPTINNKMTKKTFKASGGSVILSKNEKTIQFLFEVIRRENDAEKKLIDRMKMYKEFYANFTPGDSGFSSIPQLILVCEDDNHVVETFKNIIKNDLEIPQIKLYFTTDLRQNEMSLKNSLIEFGFDNDNNKFKAKNVELKLLD